ncbi:hypothetical protein [Frondihabitans peucedani]|uniref:Uncharacterized protein n=1 Tax=Frondihabitans peucedani TaxID=598626 RepID=A0ABP8E6K9_9MICO
MITSLSEALAADRTRRIGLVPLAAACILALALLLPTAFSSPLSRADAFAPSSGLVLRETSGDASCTSGSGAAASLGAEACPGINRLGGDHSMAPGKTIATTVEITNAGTATAGTLVLSARAGCAEVPLDGTTARGAARDLCDRIHVDVVAGSRPLFSGSAAELGGRLAAGLRVAAGVRPEESVPVTFRATLDSRAGNAYQALAASVPVEWTFTA